MTESPRLPDRDPLLTTEEVAERLRRPLATIRYWRAMGTGPQGARVMGRVVYRTSEVERWLQAQFDAEQVSA